MADDELLTPNEIAEELHLHESTPRSWVNSGKLPAERDPNNERRWLVRRGDLEKFLAEASRMDTGRPKPRTTTTEAAPDDWSRVPRKAAVDLVPASHRSSKIPEGAVVSPQSAYDQMRRADQQWAEALTSFDNFPTRLRALATAAELRSRTILLAHLANFEGTPRPGAAKIRTFADDLSPTSNRPGPPALWARFDKAVKAIGAALEDGELTPLAVAFGDLGRIANDLADACEQPAKGLEKTG